MHKNKIIQYLDRVLTALCQFYLYRHHKILLAPQYVLHKAGNLSLVEWVADAIRKRPEERKGWIVVDTYYFGDGSGRQLDYEAQARSLMSEYGKFTADPVKLECAVIILRDATAE